MVMDLVSEHRPLALALGAVQDQSVVRLEAHGTLTGGSFAAIWGANRPYTFLATAEPVEILSTLAGDNPAGTGMGTCRIHGLDSARLPISEDVTMAGTTPVLTAASFYRVQHLEGLTFGSTNVNRGAITVRRSSDATKHLGHMNASDCVSGHAHYSVPAGYRLVVLGWTFYGQSINSDVRLRVEEPGRAVRYLNRHRFYNAQDCSVQPAPREELAANADIVMESNSAGIMAVSLVGHLRKE